jgi:hypothetical protein
VCEGGGSNLFAFSLQRLTARVSSIDHKYCRICGVNMDDDEGKCLPRLFKVISAFKFEGHIELYKNSCTDFVMLTNLFNFLIFKYLHKL